MRWRPEDIPTLFTPINSIDILRHKRLTIVVLLSEKNKAKQENFAYINVPLKDFTPVEHTNANGAITWDYELLIHDLHIISSNRVVGKFQAALNFRVVGRQLPEVDPLSAISQNN